MSFWMSVLAVFIGGTLGFPIRHLWRYLMTSDKIEVEEVEKCATGKKVTWWRQKSRNGEIVCTSEPFDNVSNARRAAKAQARKLGGVKVVDRTKGEK